MVKRVILMAVQLAMLSACATTTLPVANSGPRYVMDAAMVENYRLAPGDKVRITVYGEQSLTGEYAVGTDGILSLPLAGDIPVDGKTPKEVGVLAQTRLADGYLRDPKVSVEVSAYRPFFILGEVTAAGQYPYASGMTLLNAVATAQGYTPRADKKIAYIRQAGATAEQAYLVTPTLRVMPGDTIRVGERLF